MEDYGAIFSSFEFGKHFMPPSDNLDKFKVLLDCQLSVDADINSPISTFQVRRMKFKSLSFSRRDGIQKFKVMSYECTFQSNGQTQL